MKQALDAADEHQVLQVAESAEQIPSDSSDPIKRYLKEASKKSFESMVKSEVQKKLEMPTWKYWREVERDKKVKRNKENCITEQL